MRMTRSHDSRRRDGEGTTGPSEPAGRIESHWRTERTGRTARNDRGDGYDSGEAELSAIWAGLDAWPPERFVAAIDAWAAAPGRDPAIAAFERAGARDSTGQPDAAVPLYRVALAHGLQGMRRRRATIQLASSLRNLGHVDEAVALLTAEVSRPSDELDSAVRGFLALALADQGRDAEALAHALTALATHLPRYNRSLAAYAAARAPVAGMGGGARAPSGHEGRLDDKDTD